MAQVVEYLPSKHKALSSNPNTKEGRKGGRKEEREGQTRNRTQ
jgi:hypothetical protein